MARQRRKPESAYERRIRRYLEAHPGATRQEARGHRLPKGVRSEYAKRVAGTQPGSEARRAASGHRGYRDLLRGLRDGDIVGIDPGSRRDERGRWIVVRVTVLGQDGRERTYTLRRVSEDRVRALLDRVESVGAISSPTYPVRKLLAGDDDDHEEEDEAA